MIKMQQFLDSLIMIIHVHVDSGSTQGDVAGHEVVVHCVLPRPQSSEALEFFGLLSVQPPNVRLHAHARVRVCEETLYADEDFGNCEGQAPVVVDGVEADVAVPTDVGVEDLADEANDRRAHRVAASKRADKVTFDTVTAFNCMAIVCTSSVCCSGSLHQRYRTARESGSPKQNIPRLS